MRSMHIGAIHDLHLGCIAKSFHTHVVSHRSAPQNPGKRGDPSHLAHHNIKVIHFSALVRQLECVMLKHIK